MLSRHLEPGFQPVVLESWFPEAGNKLEEWTSSAEFTAELYPVENIRGYTDVETGKFVEHGKTQGKPSMVESLKCFLGVEEEPDYLLPEETEFDPIGDW